MMELMGRAPFHYQNFPPHCGGELMSALGHHYPSLYSHIPCFPNFNFDWVTGLKSNARGSVALQIFFGCELRDFIHFPYFLYFKNLLLYYYIYPYISLLSHVKFNIDGSNRVRSQCVWKRCLILHFIIVNLLLCIFSFPETHKVWQEIASRDGSAPTRTIYEPLGPVTTTTIRRSRSQPRHPGEWAVPLSNSGINFFPKGTPLL